MIDGLSNQTGQTEPAKLFDQPKKLKKSLAPSDLLSKRWPHGDNEKSIKKDDDSYQNPQPKIRSKSLKKSSSQKNYLNIPLGKQFKEDVNLIGADTSPKDNGSRSQSTKQSKSKHSSAEDIYAIFSREKSKAIGTFTTDKYRIMRGYLEGSEDQLRLFYTKIEPLDGKRASVCIVHGAGEHSGRYLEIADSFARNGFVVHLLDLRGFGMSGGARVNASVEELHQDIEVLLRQASPNLPLFVFAHSVGAALIASLLARNPYLNISGVILASGFFGFTKERNISWYKKYLIKFGGTYLEELLVNPTVNITALSHNNHNIHRIFRDKLTTSFLGLRLVKSLVELVDFNLPKADKFNYPCLIIHGTADKITNYKAAIKFYKRISSEDKELRIVEDGMHEIHHDFGNEKFKDYVIEWACKRLEKSPKNLGDFNNLRVGLQSRSMTKTLLLLLGIVLYSLCLK